MRFHLLSSTVLLALTGFGRADLDCNVGPFAPSAVGGPAFPSGLDPETHCDSRWDTGEIIIGIEAWSARFQLKAVRFKYSQSGWTPIRGSIPEKEEAHAIKEWGAGEEVGMYIRSTSRSLN